MTKNNIEYQGIKKSYIGVIGSGEIPTSKQINLKNKLLEMQNRQVLKSKR